HEIQQFFHNLHLAFIHMLSSQASERALSAFNDTVVANTSIEKLKKVEWMMSSEMHKEYEETLPLLKNEMNVSKHAFWHKKSPEEQEKFAKIFKQNKVVINAMAKNEDG
ncbi:hypothetical protein, partial [Neisseria sp. 23W00734]|uniref:hypothetical protein n=1 Tax=Neisseria sp. 23W00734 TaxID=3374307 RepID=UPI0037569A70